MFILPINSKANVGPFFINCINPVLSNYYIKLCLLAFWTASNLL